MGHAFIHLPDTTVGGNHGERFTHDALHIVLTHAVIDHAGAAGFVHCNDLLDLTLHITLAASCPGDLGDRFSVEGLVSVVTSHHRVGVVLEAAAFQPFL